MAVVHLGPGQIGERDEEVDLVARLEIVHGDPGLLGEAVEGLDVVVPERHAVHERREQGRPGRGQDPQHTQDVGAPRPQAGKTAPSGPSSAVPSRPGRIGTGEGRGPGLEGARPGLCRPASSPRHRSPCVPHRCLWAHSNGSGYRTTRSEPWSLARAGHRRQGDVFAVGLGGRVLTVDRGRPVQVPWQQGPGFLGGKNEADRHPDRRLQRSVDAGSVLDRIHPEFRPSG